jgi:diguanylate cyclase (GGDEF)-like protein/PAS domain S-box-containing protein
MVRGRIGTDLLAIADVGELFRQSGYHRRKAFDGLTGRYLTQYAEIEALGWAACVPHQERAAYERRMRRERGRFSLTERNGQGTLVPAAERYAYYPMEEWRPLKKHGALLGFDLGSDPVLLDALRKAVDTAQPVVAEPSKVITISRHGDQAFLVLMPIYEKGAEIGTLGQRRGALKGLALGVLEAARLLSPFMTAPGPGADSVELLDVQDEGGARALGGVPVPAAEKAGFISYLLPPFDPYVVRFRVGKGWAVRASPGQLSMARQLNLAYWLILPIGSMITLLLSFLMFHVRRILSEGERMERTLRERTEELRRHEQQLAEVVRERTEDLRTANEALGRRTAFLEALVESTHDGILVVDAQRQIIFENQRYSRMRKIPASLRGDPDGKRRVGFLRTTVKDPDGLTEKIEYLYSHPGETSRDEVEGNDGTVLDRNSSPVLGRNGEYYGRIWTFHDITGLKQSEAALRESEERYRMAIENSNDGIALSKEGKHFFVNRRFLEIFGCDQEEALSMDAFAAVHPDDQERVREITAKRIRGEEVPSRYEFKGIRKDGTPLDIEVAIAPVVYRGDRVSLVYFRDITERKKTEESLRMNEKRLQTLMDAAPVGVSWSDMAGNIVYCNRKFTELFGYTLQDIPTVSDWRRMAYPDPAYRESLPLLIPAVLEAQRQNSDREPMEVLVTCKDGSTRWAGQRGAVASNLFLAIYSDLTERKKTEESLRESENKFRDLAEKALVGIYLVQDGVFKYVNSRFAEIHGYEVDQLIDRKGPQDTVVSEDLPELQEGLRRHSSGEYDFVRAREFRIMTKRGETRNVEIYSTYTIYRGKRALIGTLLDVTERKVTQDALRWKTAFLEALVDSSRDGIMVVDKQRRKVLQNRRFVDIRKIPQYVAEEKDDEKQLSYLQTTVKNPGQYLEKVNYLYSHPEVTSDDEVELLDGTVLDRHSSPVLGEGGEYYGRIWWVHDITGRKRAEEALRESENKFKDLVEKSMVGVYLLRDGIFKYVNAKFSEITGYAPSELIDGMGLDDTIHPADLDASFGGVDEGTSGERQSYQRQFRITTKTGEIRHVEAYGTATMYHGEPAIIGTVVDVTSRKIAEEALGWKTALLEAQINSTLEGILIVDREGRKILENQRTMDMWKVPPHFADDHKRQFNHMIGMSGNPEQLKGEIRHLLSHPEATSRDEIALKDGTVLDTYSAPVFGEGGPHYGRIWTFRDITEIKRYWNMLENLSTTDGLTELPNRRRFDEFLEREWRRSMREATALSVILMDIDLFKEFNDHYGHLAGDDCLRKVSKILAGIVLRPGDLIARYGGEEFACVLPGTDLAGALVVADKIRDVVNRTNIPHPYSSVAEHVTFSFGVASLVPKEGQPSSEIIGRADELLYAAKHSGRNQVRSWAQKTGQRKARIV